MYFLITSIISCFINAKKSAEMFALSCIKTKCNLSFAASFDLESSEIKNPELVVNRLRPNMVRKGEMMDVDDIVDLLSIDLIGVVPDDEYIITQTNKGEPVISNKKAPSGKAYLEISKRILGENIEVTIPGREKGFFAKIKSIFKK